MSEYYVFPDESSAETCRLYIEGTSWFPITGNKNGSPSEGSQKTTSWCDSVLELMTGEYAVPRIPKKLLDYVGVPQEDRDSFLNIFGQDIRTLNVNDFVQPVEEV